MIPPIQSIMFDISSSASATQTPNQPIHPKLSMSMAVKQSPKPTLLSSKLESRNLDDTTASMTSRTTGTTLESHLDPDAVEEKPTSNKALISSRSMFDGTNIRDWDWFRCSDTVASNSKSISETSQKGGFSKSCSNLETYKEESFHSDRESESESESESSDDDTCSISDVESESDSEDEIHRRSQSSSKASQRRSRSQRESHRKSSRNGSHTSAPRKYKTRRRSRDHSAKKAAATKPPSWWNLQAEDDDEESPCETGYLPLKKDEQDDHDRNRNTKARRSRTHRSTSRGSSSTKSKHRDARERSGSRSERKRRPRSGSQSSTKSSKSSTGNASKRRSQPLHKADSLSPKLRHVRRSASSYTQKSNSLAGLSRVPPSKSKSHSERAPLLRRKDGSHKSTSSGSNTILSGSSHHSTTTSNSRRSATSATSGSRSEESHPRSHASSQRGRTTNKGPRSSRSLSREAKGPRSGRSLSRDGKGPRSSRSRSRSLSRDGRGPRSSRCRSRSLSREAKGPRSNRSLSREGRGRPQKPKPKNKRRPAACHKDPAQRRRPRSRSIGHRLQKANELLSDKLTNMIERSQNDAKQNLERLVLAVLLAEDEEENSILVGEETSLDEVESFDPSNIELSMRW